NKPNSLHIDQELEHVFLQSIEKNSIDFIHTLKNRLRRGKVNYYDYQRYISLLRNKISYNLEEDVDKVKSADELWNLARLGISDSERSWTAKEMFRARRLDGLLEQFNQSLLNTFNMSRILEVLDTYLRRLEISTCNVFLTDVTEAVSPFRQCTHIYELM